MFGNDPLISYIFPKPMGSKSLPPNSGLYAILSADDVLATGMGAKAAAEPTRAAKRGSFMVRESRIRMLIRRSRIGRVDGGLRTS